MVLKSSQFDWTLRRPSCPHFKFFESSPFEICVTNAKCASAEQISCYKDFYFNVILFSCYTLFINKVIYFSIILN